MTVIPPHLERRVVDLFGERGKRWLGELPRRIAECERRWSLSVGEAFENLSYHWVLPATRRDGSSVVLKLGVPNPELCQEACALSAWAGRGAARLIDADLDQGALLLERLHPGTSLAELGLARDDDATTAALALMQQLHATPPPAGLRTLSDWTGGLARAERAGFAPEFTKSALALARELLASSPAPKQLHGDLHHGNILAAERQAWLAIDPKGLAGDPAYEPAAFLYNPIAQLSAAADAERIAQRRIDRFAEHFDRSRLLGWAFVQAVLSAWWSFEDHGTGDEWALHFAELVGRLR